MELEESLCTNVSHDCFGEPYESCTQCFVRYNHNEENPWLFNAEQYGEWVKKNNLRERADK
jgi:hypothetical protein